MPNANGFVGLRKWITGMSMILASWILPFFREFPMESQVFWAGVGIAVGGNIYDRIIKKKNGG